MRLLLLLSALFTALAGLGTPSYAAAVPAHQVAAAESVKSERPGVSAPGGRPVQSTPTRPAILVFAPSFATLVVTRPIVADRMRV